MYPKAASHSCHIQRERHWEEMERVSEVSVTFLTLATHDVTSVSRLFNFSSCSSRRLPFTLWRSKVKWTHCSVSQVRSDGDRLGLYSDKVKHQHQDVSFCQLVKRCMTEQLAASADPYRLNSCAPMSCLMLCTRTVSVLGQMFPPFIVIFWDITYCTCWYTFFVQVCSTWRGFATLWMKITLGFQTF